MLDAVRYNVVSLRIGGGAGSQILDFSRLPYFVSPQYHNINCINTQAQILQIQIQIKEYKYNVLDPLRSSDPKGHAEPSKLKDSIHGSKYLLNK